MELRHTVAPPLKLSPNAPLNDMKFSWLPAVAGAAVVGTVIRAVFFTPLEAKQGAAQKIFYIHVPAAWVAFLAFFLVAVASGVYLWIQDQRLDRFAESSAEVGVVFTTVVLITGPLWAKPIWGTYWAWWDVRLVSTLFLWFIYVSYIVLRGAIESPSLRAGGSRYPGRVSHSIHSFERLPLRHNASHANRRKAERALASEGDAVDADDFTGVVHASVRSVHAIAIQLRRRA